MSWVDPLVALSAFADEPWTALLLSDGAPGADRSFLFRDPARTLNLPPDAPDPEAAIRAFLAEATGTVLGLAAYELGARFEGLDLPRDPDWPDLILADYPGWLVFDHATRTVTPHGPAVDWPLASVAVTPSGGDFTPDAPPDRYEAAVAEVVDRIGRGDLFQANIAQSWSGRAEPFAAFARLVETSPAPLAAYWRLPARALVSHSPERFLAVEGRRVRTRPIKGTRPRSADPVEDVALRADLEASAKDRAENLMIVDLMRNDLSRVCRPGSVEVTALNAVEAFPHVWHLVSTVEGDLAEGRDLAALVAATFPPGSITGAPKHQAMRVIAELEARPRGPWCGSLVRVDPDGGLDSSVLIRSAAFVQDETGWRWTAKAGAGITADSDPVQERLETEAKIAGLRAALST